MWGRGCEGSKKMVDRRCTQEAQCPARVSDWLGEGVSSQDEARWAVTDTGRRRNGRELLRSAGDTEDVRSPLTSQCQSQRQTRDSGVAYPPRKMVTFPRICVEERRSVLSCAAIQGKEQARAELTVKKLFFMFAVLWFRNWSQLPLSSLPSPPNPNLSKVEKEPQWGAASGSDSPKHTRGARQDLHLCQGSVFPAQDTRAERTGWAWAQLDLALSSGPKAYWL